MTVSDAPLAPSRAASAAQQVAVGLLALALALAVGRSILPPSLMRPPEWLVMPLGDWVNAAFEFLQEDLGLIHITRAFAGFVSLMLEITNGLLTSEAGVFGLPAIPWSVLAVSGFCLGYGLRDWQLGALAGGTFVYLAVFGQWEWAMQTLALVVVAVPLAGVLGFATGALAWRYRRFETVLIPVLNVVQALPHFAYLIPVVVLFGVGDQAGTIATVIFATPPMVRMTLLGLQKVPAEVVESGKMCGATSAQLMRHVRAPTARAELLVGLNQVIMQCFAMVVIASFIGAPGLGYKLLQFLQSLRIGSALEIGVSIVLIAIALDRLSKAWVELQPSHRDADLPWARRRRLLLVWAALAALALVASQISSWFYMIPRREAVSTAFFWDGIVDWITVVLADGALELRTFLLLYVLLPIRDVFLWLPWTAVLALVAGIGWRIGGVRSAAIVAGYVLFLAISGWWDRSMITAYMVTTAVAIAVGVGLPLGIWASRRERRAQVMLLLCDTAQTFPSFVYLIPAIMLFQVNDVAAIGAVVIYGTVPMLRYTIEGLRSVPAPLVEAVDMSGATRRQKLFSLQLPLALPHIMLGLNQTVLFSLFMVIIAAFIGTRDLGQEMMKALSSTDIGQGLVLGLCVASLGLIVDHLASRWARERRRALGLD